MKPVIQHMQASMSDALIRKRVIEKLEHKVEDELLSILVSNTVDETWYEAGDQLGIRI